MRVDKTYLDPQPVCEDDLKEELRKDNELLWTDQKEDRKNQFYMDKMTMLEHIKSEVREYELILFEYKQRLNMLKELAQASQVNITKVLFNRVSIYQLFRVFDQVLANDQQVQLDSIA